PQPNQISAMLLYEMTGVHRLVVGPGLGNFLSIKVDDEAMSKTHLVRRAIVQGDAGHERGLKPAAMLIGCFEIHVGRITQFRMSSTDCAMRNAAIDPNVDGIAALRDSFLQVQLACEVGLA